MPESYNFAAAFKRLTSHPSSTCTNCSENESRCCCASSNFSSAVACSCKATQQDADGMIRKHHQSSGFTNHTKINAPASWCEVPPLFHFALPESAGEMLGLVHSLWPEPFASSFCCLGPRLLWCYGGARQHPRTYEQLIRSAHVVQEEEKRKVIHRSPRLAFSALPPPPPPWCLQGKTPQLQVRNETSNVAIQQHSTCLLAKHRRIRQSRSFHPLVFCDRFC